MNLVSESFDGHGHQRESASSGMLASIVVDAGVVFEHALSAEKIERALAGLRAKAGGE
jgi:hypothetical protein